MCRKRSVIVDLQALHKILLIPKAIGTYLALFFGYFLDAFLKYIPVHKFLPELGYFTFPRRFREIDKLLPVKFVFFCVRIEVVEGCFIVFDVDA